jgi:hypothetical protein
MTLNQKYKASGSTLSFKDWLELQKTLGYVEPKKNKVEDPIQQSQQQKVRNENKNAQTDFNLSVSYQPTNNQKKVFWIVGGLAVVGLGIWAYKKYAKK